MIALENKTEMFPPQARQLVTVETSHVRSRDPVGTAGRFVQTAENIHQRGFPGAGRADDCHHLTGGNVQRNAFQHLNVAIAGGVAAANITQFQ